MSRLLRNEVFLFRKLLCARCWKIHFMFAKGPTEVLIAQGEGSPRAKSDSDVQKVVSAAELELRRLLEKKLEIAKRIRTIHVTIAGLVQLFGLGILNEEMAQAFGLNNPSGRSGLTEACRALLVRTARAMTATEVCEHLQKEHPRLLEDHKSPLATVTTTLIRLGKQNKVRHVVQNGRRVWEFVS